MPAAEIIMQRAVERAEWSEQQHHHLRHTYRRQSALEEFNGRGALKSRQEKLFHVVPLVRGTHSRLMAVDGKPLSEKQAAEEAVRERKARERDAAGKKGGRDVLLNPELVSRFQFELLGVGEARGRPAYLLQFSARRSGREREEDVVDRILNRTSGRIWIDTEDYEVARVELELREKVSVGWGGVLAAVHDLDLVIERMRLPDGVWVVHRTEGELKARQLFSSRHFRNVESHFQFDAVSPGEVHISSN